MEMDAMNVRATKEYKQWSRKLRDRAGKERIRAYFERVSDAGRLLGDAKAIGDGVTEVRFRFGKGYRVYVAQDGESGLVLLCGGTKSSSTAQNGDVRLAKELAAAI